MKKIFPPLAAGIAGGAAFTLIIVGSRLLAPFCGTTLTLWSMLIGTALAALVAGYWLGSRPAVKHPIHRTGIALLSAGIWIILISWITHPLLHIIEPLGLRIATSIAVFVLFFPPFLSIGTIYSSALRLGTGNEQISRTSAYFIALSAFAGALLAYLMGTILVSDTGVPRSLILIGIVLLAASAYGWLFGGEKKSIQFGVAAIVVAISSTLYLPQWETANPSHGLIAVQQSGYSELRIIDTEAGRYFLQNGIVIGFTDQTTYIPYLHSTAVMELPKYFFDKPGKAVLFGLGAGSLVKQYTIEGWDIDAVEPDPAIVRMAGQYFRLESWQGFLFEMDARRFLRTVSDSCDVILINTRSITDPSYLMRDDALELAASQLRLNGILAMNIETAGWNDPRVGRLGSILKRHFQNVLALPMEEPPDQAGDVVLLASNAKLQPVRALPINATYNPDWRFGPGYQKVHAWDNRFTPVAKDAPSFIDDINPFDFRADIINFAVRREFFANFKKTDLIW
jgi:spermidine synthase